MSKVADGGQGSDAGDAAAARDGGTTCPGVLAETTFRNALCSCGSIQASAHLATDGFDGTKGPPDGGLGGSIGSNKAQAWSAHVTVGGDLLTPGDLQTSASSEVRGNLDLGGTLAASAPVTVDGNAAVVKALPRNVTVRGSVSRVSSVAAPCDCTNIVPIASMVAAYRPPANDDGSIGLSAGAAKGSNLGKIDLPSGHFYLSGIQSSGPLTIAAHGQTALYIDGNVQASGPLSFQLDPTAALDLFVAGTVSASAKLTLGVDGESGALPRVHLGLHGRSIGRRDHRVQRLRPGHFLRHVGLGRRLRLALRGRLQRERERDGPLRREHPERRQRVLRGVVLRRRQSVHGRLVQRRRQLQPRPCGERNGLQRHEQMRADVRLPGRRVHGERPSRVHGERRVPRGGDVRPELRGVFESAGRRRNWLQRRQCVHPDRLVPERRLRRIQSGDVCCRRFVPLGRVVQPSDGRLHESIRRRRHGVQRRQRVHGIRRLRRRRLRVRHAEVRLTSERPGLDLFDVRPARVGHLLGRRVDLAPELHGHGIERTGCVPVLHLEWRGRLDKGVHGRGPRSRAPVRDGGPRRLRLRRIYRYGYF